MSEPGFEILYDDEPCLVVSKPPGLLTQAPPGIDSLVVRVREFLSRREGATGDVYLGVPHRLDRPATGALALATRRRAARRLAEQFEARRVGKVYWACVEGSVTPGEGVWEDSIRKVPDEARAEAVACDHSEGRPAVLRYEVLGAGPWGTWLEIQLETGRTHQIRVQAASRGHPVLGDALYGSAAPFGLRHEDVRLRAIALHARCLMFQHPTTRQAVTVTAPVWNAWAELGIGSVAPR